MRSVAFSVLKSVSMEREIFIEKCGNNTFMFGQMYQQVGYRVVNKFIWETIRASSSLAVRLSV